MWMEEPQISFDALRHALTMAPVLSYPDFSKEFILETDALLKGLGAVLAYVDDDGKGYIIAYVSSSLHPSERFMQNYISLKLEFIQLKWAITEKF